MDTSVVLVRAAACLHLFQLPGMWMISRHVVDVRRELASLTPLAGAIVRVMALAVAALLLTLGVLVASHAEDLLMTRLGQCLALLLGAFWGVRGAVQLWYYERLAWPRTPAGRACHAALLTIFALQSAGYLAGLWLGTSSAPDAGVSP